MYATRIVYTVLCASFGVLLPACTGQEEEPAANFLAATEVVDAVIARHYDDGGTSLDVRELFKGASVPKRLRGLRHANSTSGRVGESARALLGEGERYLIFVFDHYYVDPNVVYRLREEGAGVLCECPDGPSRRWQPLGEFIDSLRHS